MHKSLLRHSRWYRRFRGLILTIHFPDILLRRTWDFLVGMVGKIGILFILVQGVFHILIPMIRHSRTRSSNSSNVRMSFRIYCFVLVYFFAGNDIILWNRSFTLLIFVGSI